MLNDDDKRNVRAAGATGNTPNLFELLRAKASTGALADIPEAINLFIEGCEINRAPKRAYIESHVPSIVVNWYFPTQDPKFFDKFIRYTMNKPGWADEMKEAASDPDRFPPIVADVLRRIQES